MIPSRPISIR